MSACFILLHLRAGHRPEVVYGEGGAEHESVLKLVSHRIPVQ
jgi:hypothetical protein